MCKPQNHELENALVNTNYFYYQYFSTYLSFSTHLADAVLVVTVQGYEKPLQKMDSDR